MPKKKAPAKAALTRMRIINAAEALFGDKGFRAMTLRDVTREAHVNLAAVNYHFGSKKDLMRAVVRNRFEPINRERLQRLDRLVAEHAPDPVPTRAIFEALYRPLFESAVTASGEPDRALIRLIGRALAEPAAFMRSMHSEFFRELGLRFLNELGRACPQLDEQTLQYRFFYAVSMMIGSIVEQTRLETFSAGKLDGRDFDRLVAGLIDFSVAGFQQ